MPETNSETVGFRLSPQQEGVLRADDEASVVQVAAVLVGPVRAGELRASLEEVTARHEILRTTFPKAVGMRARTQVVHDSLAPEFTHHSGELAAMPELMAHEARRGFDLDGGPLVRALLLGGERAQPVLVLTVHAACADARSLLVVLDELVHRGSGTSEEPVQYADYAEWRHELITGEEEQVADGRNFWRHQQEDRPAAPRILFAGSDAASPDCLAVTVPFSDDELASLSAAAQAAGVLTDRFLEAGWHALIARLTGTSELLLAGWCDGRSQPDLERAIGPYAQPIPLRTRIESETSFAEILDQVARARAEATLVQDFASGEDLSELMSQASAGFVQFDALSASDPGLEVAALNPSAGMRLLLACRWVGDELKVELWRDPVAHDEQDVTELARRLRRLVASAAANVTVPVARLAIIDAAERDELRVAAAGPEPGAEATTPVHQLFEARARLAPHAPAVAAGDAEASYGQLNAAANRLAHLLVSLGVAPGETVGLCLERSPALIQALLGILKAGGAYVPLNYEHPPARLAHQLAEAGVGVLVTESHLLDHLAEFPGEVVCLDRDRERIDSFTDQDPQRACALEDPVYVMYTSGSTGLPKGVVVTHGNLANYSTQIADRLAAGVYGAGGAPGGVDADLRFGVVSAISTDLGNTCIFPALVGGGCVQLISPSASMDGDAMAAELAGKFLDVLKITPSHLRALLAGVRAAEVLPRKWLILGGEALSWELVAEIRALSPNCGIINHYGPTETTVGCCAYDVGEPRADAATVPIGSALAGERAYVLDSALELLPPGVPGELCIAGYGVAAGYVGAKPDGNGAFSADPFSTARSIRMYRTGDRARYLRDGAIEFLGRVDDQVKIRGYRIEPGEIEAALTRHPAVRQAAVTSEADEHATLQLVAYLVCTDKLTVEELRDFLGQAVPEYMIPATFATLESLPFTPSGKIDRKALKALAEIVERRQSEYIAPRTALEQTLAEIWAQLLGLERVGVEDNFFALGGHSLLAAQVVARVRSDMAIELPLHALFAHPTIASLQSEIVNLRDESDEDETVRLVAELEGLSDAEAERLLSELGQSDSAGRV